MKLTHYIVTKWPFGKWMPKTNAKFTDYTYSYRSMVKNIIEDKPVECIGF